MNGSIRRVVFNPTSIPGLRPPRPHILNSKTIPGRSTARTPFWGGLRGRRWESTQIGENSSGHIAAQPNEAILWFDNLFPLKFRYILLLPWVTNAEKNLPDLLWRFNSSTLSVTEPMTLVRRAIPEHLPMKVTEILPRLKDGGAFIKFSHPDGVTAEEIEGLVSGFLKEKEIKPWFSPFRPIRSNLVRGVPWLEDLYRFPSPRIKIEFIPTNPGDQAAELSQETLYSLFRRYGKIAEISSQPSDSKILPKFAYLDFTRLSNSVVAKNCMHGFKVLEAAGGGKTGTLLRLSYEQRIKAHVFRDWIFGHPRIVLPIVFGFVGVITVAIFDPVRTFFIKAHITHSLRIKDSRIYKWFKSQATDIFTFRRQRVEEASLNLIWDDRKAIIDQIQSWLMEATDTFIVVQGPRGSGKKELILNQALKDRDNTLLIDCKPIQEARGDAATICAAAAEVGYRPVFSWMNSISSLVDLAAQGTIGVKSGFSQTLDTQLANILQNTATALKQITIEKRNKKDKDAALSDDDFLEAHPELRPVVVIDNFLHKNEESTVVYDKISEWAAGLTSANIAHVIFLTTDISYSKSLSKALPDRVFRQVSLGDITPEVAKRFVITHLDMDDDPSNNSPTNDKKKLSRSEKDEDAMELDACIAVLGGRLTDLEFLARRLKTGQTPLKALQEIIDQSASEIMKLFLLISETTDRKWSSEQAWYLIKALTKADQLRYNEVLLTNTFSSSLTPGATNGEAVLEALSQAELITINSSKGRPESIGPGKPVYAAAFKLLTQDHVLKSRLDLATLTELTKIEAKSIDKVETELALLATLPTKPREVAPRVQFLLTKLAASHAKVEAWEKEMGALKKVLLAEY